MILTCENPGATPPRIEPGSPRRESSSLTTTAMKTFAPCHGMCPVNSSKCIAKRSLLRILRKRVEVKDTSYMIAAAASQWIVSSDRQSIGRLSQFLRRTLMNLRRRRAAREVTSGMDICDCEYGTVESAAGRLDYWTIRINTQAADEFSERSGINGAALRGQDVVCKDARHFNDSEQLRSSPPWKTPTATIKIMGRKSNELSAAYKARIVLLCQQGVSYREIRKRVKRSHATVQYIDKFRSGLMDNAKHLGRLQVISQRKHAKLFAKPQKKSRNQCSETGGTPCFNVWTDGHASRKFETISMKKATRAEQHGRSHGRRYALRRPYGKLETQNIVQTVNHRGHHVMVWGCMSAAGVGELAVAERNMNAEGYISVLRGNLGKSAVKQGIQETCFLNTIMTRKILQERRAISRLQSHIVNSRTSLDSGFRDEQCRVYLHQAFFASFQPPRYHCTPRCQRLPVAHLPQLADIHALVFERYVSRSDVQYTIFAELPWRSRLVHRRSGVRGVLGSNPRHLNTKPAYIRQKATLKHRNRTGLERASQKQSSDTHKTPYDRVNRCRERKHQGVRAR
ncbi:hypothetical protein PR048_006763 [Dryococelus australis]|uniref:Transposase n=1 Tax=Dryococelus australis TaxID=614101 RepID=A0ABQ9IBV2_9NEOP|nr:hypothetical protein PR048_006763 [Dryococelus australis]